jgi:hypothetical protein
LSIKRDIDLSPPQKQIHPIHEIIQSSPLDQKIKEELMSRDVIYGRSQKVIL